jgi:hypothetical protein
MYLAADYIHRTPHGGRCRVRIYRPELVDAGPRHRRDLGGRPHRPTTTNPETERWRRDELTGTQDRM